MRALSWLALVWTAAVILLGAYVRLSDAGLGCPDWPGCYGHWGVPQQPLQIEQANNTYPERPLEAAKAWKEMLHRAFAGGLGLLIVALAYGAWRQRHLKRLPLWLALALPLVVIFQALLGMWTVTLQLKPLIVLLHLVGGLTLFGLLFWLCLAQQGLSAVDVSHSLKHWARLALVVVIGQILLGGWTSTNYAALACLDFPTCQRQWWPEMDFADAFVLWRGLGINYEFGVLDSAARTAIHVSHRLGAACVLLVVGGLAWRLWGIAPLRRFSVLLSGALALQIALGVGNVLLHLPLPIAVAHTGGAALLLLVLLGLNYRVSRTAVQ